jgi:hypothetical protein
MIISHGRRYIFVHIPKTGGTSMALALEGRAMKDDIMLGDTPKARNRRHRVKGIPSRGRLWKHSTLGDIDGLVSPQNIEDYFAFTLVRNPWDRMVSYYHWLRNQSFDHPAVSMAKTLGFRDFVIDERTVLTNKTNPARSYMECADRIERCDAYLRIENFWADAEPLFAHLGFNFSLPQVNRSERECDYRSYYDSETVDVVAACCREDIDRFEYQF